MAREPSIVLLGSRENEEIGLLVQQLHAHECLLLDEDWLRQHQKVNWRHVVHESPAVCLAGVFFSPERTKSVFFRPRYQRGPNGYVFQNLIAPDDAVHESDEAFARAEAEATLLGALYSLDALWVNHPVSEVFADYKLRQLDVARAEGLRTPHTVVSNDEEELRNFWHQHKGNVITKAISAFPSRWLQREVLITRVVTEGDLSRLSRAVPGPILFQELIPAAVDLRVTVVGDQVFAAAVHSQLGDGRLDWRLDYSVRFTPHNLDAVIIDRILRLATRLQLVYGAADLRLTPQGEVVFLEYNPQGAYLFIEELAGLPITRSIAEVLRTRAVARFGRRRVPNFADG